MPYQKNFDSWNNVKKQLDSLEKDFLFKERELWWCSVGVNIKHEIDGKGSAFRRPILVVRKLSRTMFFGIPTTTQIKEGSWYVPITLRGKTMQVIISQARVFHVNRFESRMGMLDWKDFNEVLERMRLILFPKIVIPPC